MDYAVQIKDSTAIKLIHSINELNATLQKLCNQSNEPKFLYAKDVSRILKMNLNSATNLMKTEEFPSIKIGILKVEKQAFLDWCRNKKLKGGDENE